MNGNTVCGDWPQGKCCSLYGVRICDLEARMAKLIADSTVVKRLVTVVKVVKVDPA